MLPSLGSRQHAEHLSVLAERAVLSAQASPLRSTNLSSKEKPWLGGERPARHCTSQLDPETHHEAPVEGRNPVTQCGFRYLLVSICPFPACIQVALLAPAPCHSQPCSLELSTSLVMEKAKCLQFSSTEESGFVGNILYRPSLPRHNPFLLLGWSPRTRGRRSGNQCTPHPSNTGFFPGTCLSPETSRCFPARGIAYIRGCSTDT